MNDDQKKQEQEESIYDAPPLAETVAHYSISHPYFGMLGTPEPVAAEEGTQAKAGTPLEEGVPIASEEQVVAAIRTVYDPEIPVNIYDLGLIYAHDFEKDGSCNILMTLTAPACPVAGEMPQMVADAVALVDGVGEITVTLTWSPPWNQDMMSEEAKLALDIW